MHNTHYRDWPVRAGRAWSALALSLIMLAGCALVDKDSAKRNQKKAALLWPAPPDQPRFAYEGLLRSAADVTVESEEMRMKRLLTGQGGIDDRPVIDKPAGIAMRNGRLYVADPAAKAVTVFDLARRKIFRFGQREPNVLARPQAIALDAKGQIYVLDSGLRKVMVFDGMGLFVFSLALDKGFSNPVGVTVSPDGNTIYVVDRGDLDNTEHKVVALGPDGRERFRLGPRGVEDGKFNIPLAAAVAGDGTLYVVDSGNFRIQAFDGQGNFRFSFGGPGAEPGRFSRPRAIAVDREGNVYVADTGFNNVQIFNAQGQLLMPLGGLSNEPGPGNYSLIGPVAVDETKWLYVVDHYFRKIEVFRRLTDEEGKRRLAEAG